MVKVGYLYIELRIIIVCPCIILLSVMNVLQLSLSILSLRIVPLLGQIKSIKFSHNLIQILGGRLVGIGKSGLDFINTFIGLPYTLSNRAFYTAQNYLYKVSTHIAHVSCMRSALELRTNHNTAE